MANILAIVGRPNVGKSTLFNRLTKTRRAIVNEAAGTTRDRQYGKSEWNGREFSVIDTGGWVVNSDDIFEGEINRQVNLAITEADVVLLVVDVNEGVTQFDMEVAHLLRQAKKPCVLAVNKVDTFESQYAAAEFYKLGLGEPFILSAVNGLGTGDLLDEMKLYAASKPYSDRVVFAGRLAPDQLRQLTPAASLGLCIMENLGLNYYLSLPNRIADYAAARVPVLANDFPEMKRAVETHRIGALADEATIHDPQRLAAMIEATIEEWNAMPADEREARFASCAADMSWTEEKNKLIHCIDTIFVEKTS